VPISGTGELSFATTNYQFMLNKP